MPSPNIENAAAASGDAAEVGDVQKQPGGVAKEEVGALRMQECPGQTSSRNHIIISFIA